MTATHAAEMVALAGQIWGPQNRAMSTGKEIRFGAKGSKSVELVEGKWYDHEARTGGYYPDLYKLVNGEFPKTNGHEHTPSFRIPDGMRRKLGPPVAWWDYLDEHGTTVARVVRFEPLGAGKTFRQCRPNGSGWVWKLDGIQIPLYGLTDLLRAPQGATVFITEGEPHADALRAWGLLATTNAGGSKKFLGQHAKVLADFACVVLPDNDQAGREHEVVVVQALRAAGCKNVRSLNLPNLPPKGDIIDWIRAGGTAAEFEVLVAKAETKPDKDDSRQDQTGQADPQTDAAPSGKTERAAIEAAVRAVIGDFNQRYVLVNEAGRACIFQPSYDPILKRRRYDRLSVRDLQTLYMNQKVQVGTDASGNPMFRTKADIWLRHPERRQFIHGVTFDPSGAEPAEGILNLWEGFAIQPAPGDWSIMRDHIKTNVCSANQYHFDYLMGWMARMLQHPAGQGEVAVVLKGGQGSGKGTLAKALLRIMGQHGFRLSNAKHLVGNFNAHLRDTIFLFADEAFFAGDKQHVGTLNAIITEEVLAIEGKHRDTVNAPNYLHLLMASNEKWVVPAALDARRFFVLLVSDLVTGNHAYFAELWQQMEAGGYAAMLHDLMNLDLDGFNVRAVPTTEALQQQRKLSLDGPKAWWMDILHRGYVFRSRLGLEKYFTEWRDEVSTELLFASYSEFAGQHRERHPMSRESLGEFMREMGGRSKRPTNIAMGEHLAEELDAYGNRQRVAKVITKDRAWGYALGSLDSSRHAFSAQTGLTIEWEPPEDTSTPD